MVRFRPLQTSREARRGELAQAVAFVIEPLLAEGGSFAELTVEQLITEVGVSRSTFYSYFTDKGALLEAMGEGAVADLLAAAVRWFELDGQVDADQVRVAITPLVQTYLKHRMIFNAITEAAAYDPTIRVVHRDLVGRAIAGLTAHVEEREREGLLPPGVSAQDATAWVTWMLERGLYQLVATAADADAERLVDAVAVLIWRCLYAPIG